MVKFKKAKPAPGKETLLSYHLHKLLAHRRPHRSLNHIHASDVTRPDFCPRRLALMEKCGVEGKKDFIHTAMQMVYHQGEVLESSVQRWSSQIALAVGWWRCGSCGILAGEEITPKPEACAKCGFHLFRYEQVRPVSQDSGISCGLDLLVKFPGLDKFRIIECKTYDKDKFQSLSAPLAEHRDRTRLYLRCSDEDPRFTDVIDTETANVFYISKGGFGDKTNKPIDWGLDDAGWSPFKEFLVAAHHESVEPFAELARPLWKWKQGGPMCGGICATGFDKHAQKCEVLKECFSGDYPAGK